MCCYCDSLVDNAEHALFVCAKWGVARVAVGQAVGAELTPDTMVSLMLQSERIWTLIKSFVTLVMKTKELDGRRERNNFSFPSPGWCGWSVKPNGLIVLVRERGFLVLAGMPGLLLGESCTTSIKESAIFSPRPKKKNK